jgi:hypothetical protein
VLTVHGDGQQVRVPADLPVRPGARTAPPARPADRDCADFGTQAEAQAFYNRYLPFCGDFARLDSDNDGIVCESLP